MNARVDGVSKHITSSSVFQGQWSRLLAALAEVGTFTQTSALAQTPYTQAQSVRYMLRLLEGMVVTALEHEDVMYPKLVRMFDPSCLHPNTNPDCVYFFARLSPEHTYRIHGAAGSARILEVQVMDGHFPAGPNHKSLHTLTDLKGEATGHIEIVLSATPQPGNWVRLDPTAAWIYVRQYYYDWATEEPADLVIERVGATYPPEPISAEELRARVDRIIGWIPTWYRHLASRVAGYYNSPKDSLAFFMSPAGMDDLSYGKSSFDLAADEAMIMEFKPTPCRYWGFQLMNDFWETLAFDVHQSSLNGHQGRLDADGVFRAVISVTDPGVPNWLDPVGNSKGLICARILRPEQPPQVSLKKVKLAQLREHLPADTPKITTAQRSASLRDRMLATARRFRE
ncbi:MAG: DUF1214 domain-containing protein [Steroidobacteraceae bacterium]